MTSTDTMHGYYLLKRAMRRVPETRGILAPLAFQLRQSLVDAGFFKTMNAETFETFLLEWQEIIDAGKRPERN